MVEVSGAGVAELVLVEPHPGLQGSFLAAVDEFVAAGEAQHAGLPNFPADGSFAGLVRDRDQLADPGCFAEYVAWLVDQPREDAPRPAGYVPFTERWMVVDGVYVGRISLRHRLTDLLLTWGGHIGYAVRPSARRRGHASAALHQLLPVCAGYGIDPVLVTCDPDNVGSRRVIEANGGVYEDTRHGKRRYWVPTGHGS